jgi:hypothetical protein
MVTNRKLVGAAAFSLALAGGGVAGALLGSPSVSGAQDEDTETTDNTATDESFARGWRAEHRGERLATAAEALGITEAELLEALQDGQSIAQVAEAEGVDVQVVIDALVADATERLEELEASLPERMTDLVNREGLPEGRGPGHHGPGRHLMGAGLDTAADAIGITADELRAALQDGSTIAEVAAEHDVEAQAVIDALVAEATARIDEAVADGAMDADRADEIKADLVERITAHVNGEHPMLDGRGPAWDDAD